MATDASKQEKTNPIDTSVPKSKQLVQMLSFRIVPAFFREIEKTANNRKMTVSKLIRSYIKEGLKRDRQSSVSDGTDLRV